MVNEHNRKEVSCRSSIGSQGSNNTNLIFPFFSIFNVVRKLKEQRMGMVTTEAQYKYIYEFSVEWVKKNYEYM